MTYQTLLSPQGVSKELADPNSTYVYAIVVREALKVGHSGRMLNRMRNLCDEYFRHISIDTSFAYRFDNKEDARRAEKYAHTELHDEKTQAPTDMHFGGKTEWFNSTAIKRLRIAAPCIPLKSLLAADLRVNAESAIFLFGMHRRKTEELQEKRAGCYAPTQSELICLNLLDEYAAFDVDLA